MNCKYNKIKEILFYVFVPWLCSTPLDLKITEFLSSSLILTHIEKKNTTNCFMQYFSFAIEKNVTYFFSKFHILIWFTNFKIKICRNWRIIPHHCLFKNSLQLNLYFYPFKFIHFSNFVIVPWFIGKTLHKFFKSKFLDFEILALLNLKVL